MTTTEPPPTTTQLESPAAETRSAWSVRVRQPGRDRRLVIAAGIAVLCCLLLTALTVHWRRDAVRNDRAAADAVAATAGARAATNDLTALVAVASADAAELQRQVDDGAALLDVAIADRGAVRAELASNQLTLAALQGQLDGAYATVLQRGDAMAQLDACLKGVSRALNLAAIESNALAIEVLLASFDACEQSKTTLGAAKAAAGE